MFLFFLSSGMFLGWSLGANDAANVFGTAVGTRMLRFRTAAALCCLFVMLGAVISGSGASATLGKLGAVNAIAGAFVVAFAAAVSVYLMLKARIPVSTSQSIVGAIVGWNLFSGSQTDSATLATIALTWVVCPLMAGIVAVLSYKFLSFFIRIFKVQMFTLDKVTRFGLVLVGAFGSFSLGANNIANVVGVFLPVSPFKEILLPGGLHFSAAQQLFFLGSVAISVGVVTYSRRVMGTVGSGIFRLSPLMAFVAVWAHSVVLFLFASQQLQQFLISKGLPSLPLVPVSSSQAIVGAVVGMGLLKGGHNIQWKTVGGIVLGWVTTPLVACLVSFICLFVLQNVFQQVVYLP
ncbi:inorganic phosphate transporter [Geopsychrobacter electrodiphilus]|uniref:inorganic phosphate transporter n=1 Tax=Geopsychrobacter electrodiphilus TaxID=225196 RepID=UPI0003639C2D|nr:inorganic phosphate transporter [Geopsychrobacter electrodiphilus]